jgi:GWxTD domain-containing protein
MNRLLQFLLPVFFIFPFISTAKNPKAYFNYCTFHSPTTGPYLETYISLMGYSLEYAPVGNQKQAKVEITLIVKKGNDIVDFKKYSVAGPEIADSLQNFPNFIDQQRFSLPPGTYELELEITDLNGKKEEKLAVIEQLVIENYKTDFITISDIQLIESFKKAGSPGILTKSGYDLVPYLSYFYPKTLNNLTFYAEIYNSDKAIGMGEKYLISYYLESFETSAKMSQFNIFLRKDAGEVTVVLGDFPIDKLPSGNYNLVIEARNKSNELLADKRIFIQRSNSGVEMNINDLAAINIDQSFVSRINNPDTLAEYIRCLRPISSQLERTFAENQLKNSDLKLKQQFFHNFWTSRNSLNPEQDWNEYHEKVKKVNALYGSRMRKGYDSDRGRVYLQYGEPSTISQQYREPSAYPYEIWHYYRIGNFNNRRFVFYSPDLATNEFPLLHSDMFGEINNPRWQVMLHRRDQVVYDLQDNKVQDHFGGNSGDFFRNPR